jgi:hypothetical protein
MTFYSTRIFYYLGVGMLWGCTNPFIRRGQKLGNVQAQQVSKAPRTIIGTLWGFFTNINVFLPYLINQLGSLLFYYLVAVEPVQTAAPVCNNLAFMFTAITAYLLGEPTRSPVLLLLGVLSVSLGLMLVLSEGEGRSEGEGEGDGDGEREMRER